jgi:hypothetical protein
MWGAIEYDGVALLLDKLSQPVEGIAKLSA